MGKAYISKPLGPTWHLWLPQAELDHLDDDGYAVMPDMRRLVKHKAIIEVDDDTLSTRPVAVYDDSYSTEFIIGKVKRAHGSMLFRADDIVDMETICFRTNRSKTVVSGRWKKEPDWPEPRMRLGKSDGWYWPDIVAFLRRHNWPLWRAEWDKPRTEVS